MQTILISKPSRGTTMAGMDPNSRSQVTLAAIQPPNWTMATMDYTTVSPFSPLSRSHHQSNPSPSNSGAGAGERTMHLQWAHQETVELISIRGDLERDFIASKRNKALWETVASRMREKGFIRTLDQCKCKWKNLVNRYKGKETSDPDNGKQCPFFEELHAVFSERAKALQRSFMESQTVTVQSRKRMKSNSGDRFSDDFSQDEGDEGDDSGVESLMRNSNSRKRRAEREKHVQTTTGDISSISSIQEMLKAFFQQQKRLEMQWRGSMERHHHERELFEQEWRQSMEKLERERLMMEQEWMEREEQRKIRDEIRAENRDTLLTTLLNKLISED